MKKQSRYISVSLVFLLLFQLFVFGTSSNVYATDGTLRVQLQLDSTSPSTDTIKPNFKIYNDGTSSIDMSNVKLRYYYTKDGSTTQHFACDSYTNDSQYDDTITKAITGNFIDKTPTLALCDNYLEISFPAGVSLAANKCIELRTRIYKENYTNYSQSNDYSFNYASTTTYVDWDKVTAYTSGTLSWGIDPDNAAKKFLVILSSKIWGYCSTAINTYMSDLSAEGWAPTLVKVNNVQDYVCDSVCPDAQSLKTLIRGYYNQGYEGFVLIGSSPSIPCVKWEKTQSSNDNATTDLFYADMDEWSDQDQDGMYEGHYSNNNTELDSSLIPEMMYGRISAGTIVAGSDNVAGYEQPEGLWTAAYLSKIHDYRFSGGTMAFDPKAFYFADDDWSSPLFDQARYLKNLEPDVYSKTNKLATTKASFFDFLQGGYRIGYGVIHSIPLNWTTYEHPNGPEDVTKYEYPNIADINNITVRVNYLNLTSCKACDYATPNLGAALLFNNVANYDQYKNSYVYNVTGLTSSVFYKLDAGYYEDLKSYCIGTSFKNYLTRLGEDTPALILLGDPTLKYNFTNPANECPSILNDFSDTNAYPNKPFEIKFQTTDPENDAVFLNVEGLPDGATYDSSTKTLNWTPSISQAGNSYNVTITAYNTNASGEPINRNVQSFTLYVPRITLLSPLEIANAGFESLGTGNTFSSWVNYGEGEKSADSVIKHSGNYSARITNDSDSKTGSYVLTGDSLNNTNIEPNTHYLISCYIKTVNAKNPAILITNNSYFTDENVSVGITGTQDWTPVYYYWYSGDYDGFELECSLTGTGTAWFDDIKMEKAENLGFELLNKNLSPLDENALSYWTTYSLNQNSATTSAASFGQDSNIKYSGNRSGKIYSCPQSPNYAYLNTQIPVEPNSTYRVGVFMRTQDVISQSTGAYLEAKCGTNSVVTAPVSDSAFTWYNNNAEPDPTEWAMRYLVINTGANTTMNIYCKLGNATDLISGTAWFDNIVVTKV